eukprot:2587165-Rhodomonas_salina.1
MLGRYGMMIRYAATGAAQRQRRIPRGLAGAYAIPLRAPTQCPAHTVSDTRFTRGEYSSCYACWCMLIVYLLRFLLFADTVSPTGRSSYRATRASFSTA